MLDIETAHVGAPDDAQIRFPRARPEEPECLGLMGLAREFAYLDQDDHPAADGARLTRADRRVRFDDRMQARPDAHANLPVLRIFPGVFDARCGPGRGVLADELGTVESRASVADIGSGIGISVETAITPQADEDRRPRLRQAQGQFDRIVACVEDEQRDGWVIRRETGDAGFDLCDRRRVGRSTGRPSRRRWASRWNDGTDGSKSPAPDLSRRHSGDRH